MLRASEKRPSISTLALGVPREDSDPLPTACRDLEFEPPNTLGRMAVWIVISFLAIGTAFFSTAEGWSAADALASPYFAEAPLPRPPREMLPY